MDRAFEEHMRATHRTCLVICMSMPFSVVVLVGIARWLELKGTRDALATPSRAVFIVLAVLALAASVGSWFARGAVERFPVRRLSQLDSAAGSWGQGTLEPADALLGGLYVGAIVAFMIGEVGALLGFAYFIMGGGWAGFGALIVPSLAAWVANMPRLEDWRTRLEGLPETIGA